MNADWTDQAEIFLWTCQQYKLKNNQVSRHRGLQGKNVRPRFSKERRKILVINNYLLRLHKIRNNSHGKHNQKKSKDILKMYFSERYLGSFGYACCIV